MNIKEQRAVIANKKQQLKAITQKAKSENRKPTNEEQTAILSLKAEIKSLGDELKSYLVEKRIVSLKKSLGKLTTEQAAEMIQFLKESFSL